MCKEAVQQRSPKRGDIVTINYSLTPENDYVPLPLFDTHGTKTRLVLGWGNYLPGLHDLISTMEVGQTISDVSIDAGWGEKDMALVARVSKRVRPGREEEDEKRMIGDMKYGDIRVGMKFVLRGNNGGNGDIKVMVTEVTDDDFVLDANPPLAGSSYNCEITLLAVEEAPRMDLVERREDKATKMAKREQQIENESAARNKIEDESESCVGDTSSDIVCECPLCKNSHYEVATFALGCFWGAELAFMRTPGVAGTRVGYTRGGETTTQENPHHHDSPSYDEVCAGKTGLAEAILVLYDPDLVSYRELADVALERLKVESRAQPVGLAALFDDEDEEDWGKSQYRHGFYFHTEEQRGMAKQILFNDEEDDDDDEENEEIEDERRIFTPPSYKIKEKVEVKPASTFYEAEEYHQQYLLKGGQSARKGCKETIRCFG